MGFAMLPTYHKHSGMGWVCAVHHQCVCRCTRLLVNVASPHVPLPNSELQRVLAPGARVAVLDFNNASVSNPTAAGFQTWTLDNVVVPLARLYGVEEEYAYLVPSIQAFPTGKGGGITFLAPHVVPSGCTITISRS